MPKEIIINASKDRSRIAIVEDGNLVELYVENPDNVRTIGNIYLGRVRKIMPAIRAAFVDIGQQQDAFLHFSDLTDNVPELLTIAAGDIPDARSLMKAPKSITANDDDDTATADLEVESDEERRSRQRREQTKRSRRGRRGGRRRGGRGRGGSSNRSEEEEEESAPRPRRTSPYVIDLTSQAATPAKSSPPQPSQPKPSQPEARSDASETVVADAPASDTSANGDAAAPDAAEDAPKPKRSSRSRSRRSSTSDESAASSQPEAEATPDAEAADAPTQEASRDEASENESASKRAPRRRSQRRSTRTKAAPAEAAADASEPAAERASENEAEASQKAGSTSKPKRSSSRRSRSSDASAAEAKPAANAEAKMEAASEASAPPEDASQGEAKAEGDSADAPQRRSRRRRGGRRRSRRSSDTTTDAGESADEASSEDRAAKSDDDNRSRRSSRRRSDANAADPKGESKTDGGADEASSSDKDGSRQRDSRSRGGRSSRSSNARRDTSKASKSEAKAKQSTAKAAPPIEMVANSKRAEDYLNRDQNILVKIIKEPISAKGSRISTDISLAGRFMVLVPMADYVAVSKKIESSKERRRLRSLASSLRPEGFGIIVRTVADGRDAKALDTDLRLLLDKWRSIEKQLRDKVKPPAPLYEDVNMVSSIIRDLFTDDFDRILIDDPKLYRNVKGYVEAVAPQMAKNVQLYSGRQGVFRSAGIERSVEEAFSPRVNMKSGGYLFIEHTEAMHVVDVNSGRAGRGKSQAQNLLDVNLEAAREIAKQLRLRDLGGIICVDFIDMRLDSHRKKLYDTLKQEFRKDRAVTKLLPMSDFGVVQITRQRLRPSITADGDGENGQQAAGAGEIVQSERTRREVERLAKQENVGTVTEATVQAASPRAAAPASATTDTDTSRTAADVVGYLEAWLRHYRDNVGEKHKNRPIVVRVHPFLAAFLKRGIPSTLLRWRM
ncbi:MAG: Rne/Rng family ribonuclease, partial [Bacteroidota bacterium]